MKIDILIYKTITNLFIAILLLLSSIIPITVFTISIIPVASIILAFIQYKLHVYYIDNMEHLHSCVENNDNKKLKELIEYGADVNKMGYLDHTPLDLATIYNNTDIAITLINAGAEINLQNKNGRTTLDLILEYNRKEILTPLIENDLDVDEIGWHTEYLMFEYAIENNKTELALKIIDKNNYINAKEKYDAKGKYIYSPLQDAALFNNTKVISKLIEIGTDINVKDQNAKTPLHKAAREHHTKSILELIEKGANVHARDVNNHTPLHIAVKDIYDFNENSIPDVSREIDSIIVLIVNGANLDSDDNPSDFTINYEKKYILREPIENLIVPYLRILIEYDCLSMLITQLQRTPLKQEHLNMFDAIDNKTMAFIKEKYKEATVDTPLESHKKELAKAICGHPNQSPYTDTKVKIGLFSMRYNLRDSYLKAYILFLGIKKLTENKIIQNILEYAGIIPMSIEKFDISLSDVRKKCMERNLSPQKRKEYDSRYGLITIPKHMTVNTPLSSKI
jgi:ankyrin repeat protein